MAVFVARKQTKVGEADITTMLRKLALFRSQLHRCQKSSWIYFFLFEYFVSRIKFNDSGSHCYMAASDWLIPKTIRFFKPVCSEYYWIFIFMFHFLCAHSFASSKARKPLPSISRRNWRFRTSILRFVSLNKTDYHKPFNYQPHFLGTATERTVLYFYLIW